MTDTAPRRRRAKGTGSVTFRPRDGRWTGQLDLGKTRDGRRIRRTVFADSPEGVEEQLAQLRSETGLPAPRPRKATTLALARLKGAHTAAQWDAKRDAVGCCVYCGSAGPLVKDHATPIARGGSDGIENVAPSCYPCNAEKGTATAAEFIRCRLMDQR